jgi:thiol-disulfide isomerase/thioredoxin
MTVFDRLRLHMPPLDGATAWINSEPLSPEGLRGRVVLVDFWTLTCINWLRTAPYVRAWSRAYRDDGLVVVGVHTPEFSFEHEVDLVREATNARGIDYPVAVDDGYAIWNAFANHYWPALYFVDRDGVIRDQHFGEGRYEESERVIQRLLGVERALVSAEGDGVERAADWPNLRTPETYLGYRRGDDPVLPVDGPAYDRAAAYELPERLRGNSWGLRGRWTVAAEKVVLEQAGGSIGYRFSARDAHLVLCSGPRTPIPFDVRLDGEVPGPSHGVDVDQDGNGVLREGRMYQLVRQRAGVRERSLEITFHEAGAEAYAFTFG